MAGDRTGKRGSQRLAGAVKRQSGLNTLRFGAERKKIFKKAGPSSTLDNGWQLLQEGVQDRVSNMFNCKTLSDLILVAEGKEIPAHSLILASASPVFYHRLFEVSVEDSGAPKWSRLWECQIVQEVPDSYGQYLPVAHTQGMPPRGTPSSPLRIEVEFKFEPFYEFLRYLYTDEADMKLSNATQLLYMADDFKVPDLFDKCVQFLRDEVAPSTALRLTITFRRLLCKVIMTLWRDYINYSKAQKHFMTLDFSERRARFQEYKTGQGSRMISQAASTNASIAPQEDDKMSVLSFRTAASSKKPQAAGEVVLQRSAKRGSVLDAVEFDAQEVAKSAAPTSAGAETAAFGLKDVHQLTDVGRRLKFLGAAKVLQFQLAHDAQECVSRCWKCVQKDTEEVLQSAYFKHLEMSVVKEVLSCKHANAREICFFRALNEWAQHQCRLSGLPYLPEHRREILGKECIELVRFPLLTLEQLLWEVAPTGMLDHEDLQTLQQIKTGSVDAKGTKFNPEPRKAMADFVSSLKRKTQGEGLEEIVNESIMSGSLGSDQGPDGSNAEKDVTYTPAATDEVDHFLASKLYRDHVFDSVVSQQEARLASEAGVPPDPEKRPIFCGEMNLQQLPDSFKNMELAVMGSNRPNMFFLRQELKTEAIPMQASAEEMGYRQHASSTDFRRISPGLYNFRGERTLEMRFEDGEPYIYETRDDRPATVAETGHRPPSVPLSSQRPHSVAGHTGETGAALRARLAQMRRVPLDGFLTRCAPV